MNVSHVGDPPPPPPELPWLRLVLLVFFTGFSLGLALGLYYAKDRPHDPTTCTRER